MTPYAAYFVRLRFIQSFSYSLPESQLNVGSELSHGPLKFCSLQRLPSCFPCSHNSRRQHRPAHKGTSQRSLDSASQDNCLGRLQTLARQDRKQSAVWFCDGNVGSAMEKFCQGVIGFLDAVVAACDSIIRQPHQSSHINP